MKAFTVSVLILYGIRKLKNVSKFLINPDFRYESSKNINWKSDFHFCRNPMATLYIWTMVSSNMGMSAVYMV